MTRIETPTWEALRSNTQWFRGKVEGRRKSLAKAEPGDLSRNENNDARLRVWHLVNPESGQLLSTDIAPVLRRTIRREEKPAA